MVKLESSTETALASAADAALASGIESSLLSTQTLEAVQGAEAAVEDMAPPAPKSPAAAGAARAASAPAAPAPLLPDAAVVAAAKALAVASAQLSESTTRASELLEALKASAVRQRDAKATLSAAAERLIEATMQLDSDREAIDMSLVNEQVPVPPSASPMATPLPTPTAGTATQVPIFSPVPHPDEAPVLPLPYRLVELRQSQAALLADRISLLGRAGKELRAAHAKYSAARNAASRDASGTRAATAAIFRAAEAFARARLAASKGYMASVRSIVEQARSVSGSVAVASAAASRARKMAEAKLREVDLVYRAAESRATAGIVRASTQAEVNPAAMPSTLSTEASAVRAAETAVRTAVVKEDSTALRAAAAAKAVVLTLDAQVRPKREEEGGLAPSVLLSP